MGCRAKNKSGLKFILRWKEHEGGFWQSLREVFKDDSNVRWWWEVHDRRGNVVAKSIVNYATEADAVAGALGVQEFIAGSQTYDVRKASK